MPEVRRPPRFASGDEQVTLGCDDVAIKARPANIGAGCEPVRSRARSCAIGGYGADVPGANVLDREPQGGRRG